MSAWEYAIFYVLIGNAQVFNIEAQIIKCDMLIFHLLMANLYG